MVINDHCHGSVPSSKRTLCDLCTIGKQMNNLTTIRIPRTFVWPFLYLKPAAKEVYCLFTISKQRAFSFDRC